MDETQNTACVYVQREGQCTACSKMYNWTEFPDVILDFYDEDEYATVEILHKTLCESCFDEQIIIDESISDVFSSFSTSSDSTGSTSDSEDSVSPEYNQLTQ